MECGLLAFPAPDASVETSEQTDFKTLMGAEVRLALSEERPIFDDRFNFSPLLRRSAEFSTRLALDPGKACIVDDRQTLRLVEAAAYSEKWVLDALSIIEIKRPRS